MWDGSRKIVELGWLERVPPSLQPLHQAVCSNAGEWNERRRLEQCLLACKVWQGRIYKGGACCYY
jgi:hypothetical protein